MGNPITMRIRQFFNYLEEKYENSSTSREVRLLNQLYTSLSSTYSKLINSGEVTKSSDKVLKEVESLLRTRKSWRNVYKVEQLLLPYLNEDSIDIEWGRRLTQARSRLNSDLVTYYEKSYTAESSIESKRYLLNAIVGDMQWSYENRQIVSFYERTLQLRLSMAFVFSMLLFFGPNVAPGVYKTLLKVTLDNSDSLIYMSITAGMMGALFSVLVSLRKSVQNASLADLRIMKGKTFPLMKASIGGGGGLILYYLLKGGILSGSVFPIIDDSIQFGDRTYALLVVWCFLSGFSEKMVPNLLSTTSKRGGGAKDKDCDEKK